MAQVDTDKNNGLFLHKQLAHLQAGNTQKKVSNIASQDIMENYYMSVMLLNLSVISHLIFPQCFFMSPYQKQKLWGILFYRCLSVCRHKLNMKTRFSHYS